MRAAAGTGQGVAVGGCVGVGLVVGIAVADTDSLAVAAVWGVGLAGGWRVVIAGGGTSRAMRPVAASGAAIVGKMGVGSAGSAHACKGSGKRMAYRVGSRCSMDGSKPIAIIPATTRARRMSSRFLCINSSLAG